MEHLFAQPALEPESCRGGGNMLCLYWCQDRGDEAVSGYVKTFDLLPSWTLDTGQPKEGGN